VQSTTRSEPSSVVTIEPPSGATPRVRSVFISDVHLGSRGCRAEALLDFLRRVRCEQLYLVGDIVDLWCLRRGFFWPEAHTAVLREILRKAATGTRVVYVPGNHDADLRELVGAEIRGVEVHRDCIHVTADGRRLLVTHGDDFDGVVACQPWLAALGSSVYDYVVALNRVFNEARRLIGLPYWSLAGFLKGCSGKARRYIGNFEHAAAYAARRQGLDGIVCGHIHRHEIATIDGVVYANDGDWVENCTALVEDRNGRLAIWHWPHARVAQPAAASPSIVEEAA
jgi:UDP-2,3-diacylglucosamine pyrophosphatase LpxH